MLDVAPQPEFPHELLKLPPVGRAFYATKVRELLPLLGSHEHQPYDFHAAIEQLSSTLNLGFSRHDQAVMAFMLTGLSQSARFSGDLHIEPWLGENSAVHCAHCALLATDRFDLAGLLHASVQSREVVELRLLVTIGCLLHDMGEMLGEFSSVAQRLANSSLKEVPEVERRIFALTLKTAYAAVERNEPVLFYRSLRALRVRAGIVPGQPVDFKTLNALLDEYESDVCGRVRLSPENEVQYQRFLRIYDAVELKRCSSPLELVGAHAVKLVEHIQGTRHMNRFITKDHEYRQLRVFGAHSFPTSAESNILRSNGHRRRTTLAGSLTSSAGINASLSYLESGLFELFESAITPETKRLAESLRIGVYETAIEKLNVECYVLNRRAEGIDPRLPGILAEIKSGDLSRSQIEERLQAAEQLLREERAANLKKCLESRKGSSRTEDENRLYEAETVCRLMSLYMRAIETGYVPKAPKVVLASLDPLPEELKPLKPIKWHLRRNGGFLP